MRRAQRGDADAFERLARPCGPTLYRVAASCLGGNDADAADAVQNALIAAWRNIGSLREPRYFKPWLIRITINACRSLQHARATTVPLEAVDEERLDASLRQEGRSDETARAAAASDADASFRAGHHPVLRGGLQHRRDRRAFGHDRRERAPAALPRPQAHRARLGLRPSRRRSG